MTLGQKLKEIRKRFGLSQEQLAEIMNVSRQAITKWENDGGLPDISNLQELAKTFGITIDYLLNDDNQLPALTMYKELDKEKYPNKLDMYIEVLREYFPEPYEVYTLQRFKKMNILERVLDVFTGGLHHDLDHIGDISPYYYIKKDNLKLLVNIKNYVLEVVELPNKTKDKAFTYKQNHFVNCGKLKVTK